MFVLGCAAAVFVVWCVGVFGCCFCCFGAVFC